MTEPPLNASHLAVPECVEENGPWPFVTRRVYRLADQSTRIWSSRHHRKDLLIRVNEGFERQGFLLRRCLWMPRQLNWWVVLANLLGCVGFMISAIFAVFLPTDYTEAITLSTAFTLIGAIGFLVGSLLMLPETAQAN